MKNGKYNVINGWSNLLGTWWVLFSTKKIKWKYGKCYKSEKLSALKTCNKEFLWVRKGFYWGLGTWTEIWRMSPFSLAGRNRMSQRIKKASGVAVERGSLGPRWTLQVFIAKCQEYDWVLPFSYLPSREKIEISSEKNPSPFFQFNFNAGLSKIQAYILISS